MKVFVLDQAFEHTIGAEWIQGFGAFKARVSAKNQLNLAAMRDALKPQAEEKFREFVARASPILTWLQDDERGTLPSECASWVNDPQD